MTETGDNFAADPGSGSQPSFPFAWRAPAVVGQDTIISAPRREEGSDPAPAPAAATSVPSPLTERLFPGQTPTAALDDVADIRLGHFVVERRIGTGGMGTVFLARDERLQRPVALKILSPAQTADPAAVQRFQNEARAAARLDHDHVARVFYYGEDQGLHYIAFEYVQGANLRDVIRTQRRLDAADVVNYAVQLASALCHTSANGVVHRDIKPSNIIITPAGKAKLVDLGLARKESLDESAQLTVAGTTLGTFDYIAPEQARDPRNVDVRSDIYSLGCTLYHAVTGELPYPEGTVLQRLLDHQDKEPPDPALKNRRLPPALSAIIRKMMQADPRRRYASAEDLLRDLLLLAGSLGLRAMSADSAVMAALLPARRSFWVENAGWIATAAVLAAVVWVLQKYPAIPYRIATGQYPVAAAPLAQAARPSADAAGPDARAVAAPPPFDAATETVTSPARATGAPLRADGDIWLAPGERDASAAVVGDSAASGTASDAEELATPLLNLKKRPFDGVPPAIPERITLPEALADGPLVGGATSAKDARRPEGGGVRGPTLSTTGAGKPPAEGTARPARPAETAATEADQLPVADAAGPFLLVGSGKSFDSLESACAEAKDQATIELHFDGRRPAPEHPIRLVNKRLTIQAAKGRRPVITFVPREAVVDAAQARMIVVAGGSLALVNVDLEFRVPETVSAELWTLLTLHRPERLRLQGVNVSVINPRHQAAAVLELVPPPSDSLTRMGAMKDGMPLPMTVVIVERSLVRGEAEGLRVRELSTVRAEFDQSVFALGETLVHATMAPEAMNDTARLVLDVNRSTCVLGGSLLASNVGEDFSGRKLPVEILARNSIFACGPGRPLIEQNVPVEAMEFRKSLSWVGERNFFDNLDRFWIVNSAASGPGMQRWDFAAWKNHWGAGEASGSQNAPIGWRRSWRQLRWSEITKDDVELDAEAPGNPPIAGAADGASAGAALADLPPNPR